MSFNILDAVKGHLSPDLIAKATSVLGENESGITKAFSGILPTVIGGMISKASSGDEGAKEVFNMAKDSFNSGFPGGIGNIFSDGGAKLGKGLDLIKGLLGDKLSGIINSISNFAGIKNSSASSLMSLAAPVAAGTLGKHAFQNNLDAGGLFNLLSSQKNNILGALPKSLSGIAGSLGLGNIIGDVKGKVAEGFDNVTGTGGKAGAGMRWVLPFLLVLVAVLIAWWFLFGGKNGCSAKQKSQDTAVNNDTTRFTPVTTEGFRVKLPDGTELNALKGGIEDKLVAFLNTDWRSLGEDSLKKTWFDFDNLNFETGSATINFESQAQINNMAAILKAFPEARLKIGGYTDKSGNEVSNIKLSGDRAGAVKEALEKAGVGNQVTKAEGYGSEFARYPSDAPESDRVKDRRISVSVRE